MSNYSLRVSYLPVALIAAGSVAACGPAKHDESRLQEFPVEWTQEFAMPELLDQAAAIDSQKDLQKLLELPWYVSIDVQVSESENSHSIASCNDYFAVGNSGLRAKKEHERNAFLEFIVMCEATRLLSEASAAQKSNLPADLLDERLPKKLPKSVALITSQSEADRIMEAQSFSKWGDVNAINNVEQTSKHQADYRSDAGLQTVSVLGRGDFNHDGREDLLASVKDTVEGGNYFNLRLFVLTVTDQGRWTVEAEY